MAIVTALLLTEKQKYGLVITSGDFTTRKSIHSLDKAIEEAFEGERYVVVSFCGEVGPDAVGILCAAAERAKKREGELILAGLPVKHHDVLRQVATIYFDLDQAAAALTKMHSQTH